MASKPFGLGLARTYTPDIFLSVFALCNKRTTSYNPGTSFSSLPLRTDNGLEIVNSGDLLFFEIGEHGAHQLFNHGTEPCIYLDVRTSIGYDVCEYPDSNKILLAPSMEIFNKDAKTNYFEGEENVVEKWKEL